MKDAYYDVMNLTGKLCSPAQKRDGVIEPSNRDNYRIKSLLIFVNPPSALEMEIRAQELVEIAGEEGYGAVMIDGPVFFILHLVAALKDADITPLFSFTNPDGNHFFFIEG